MQKLRLSVKIIAAMVKFSCFHLFIVMLTFGVSLAEETNAQELLARPVSITIVNQDIRTALSRIGKSAEIKFSYDPTLLQNANKVNLTVRNEPLAQVLDKVLNPLRLSYDVSGKYIILKRQQAQSLLEMRGRMNPLSVPIDVTVSGKVTDENGSELPGVNVLVKGTQRGTSTDSNGEYTLSVPDPSAVLVFSFVGYETMEMAVGNNTRLNVSLKVNTKALSEVVVVGYGTQSKKDVTGSIASLNTQAIKDMPVTNIAEGMAGRMPGVLVQQASGAPGSGPSIKIRGLGSISAGNGPLIVVDGQPLNSGDLVNGSGLNLINPNDIETVDVLKDASATAIFGSRGANGVVMITTKRGKAGKSTINLDYYTGIQEVSKTMDMLNAQQFVDFSKSAHNNAYLERVPGASVSDLNSARPAGQRYRYPRGEFPGLDFDNPAGIQSYDYQSLIFRTAPISNYQLSASGGSDKVQYMVSGNYLKQDGIIKQSGIDRYTFRSNVDAQVSPRIKVGMSISPSFTKERRVNSDGHWASNGVINAALSQVPIVPIYQADGVTYNSQASIAAPYDWAGVTNPVANITEADNNVNTLRLLGNTYLEVGIWKTLKYRGSVGGDITYLRQNLYRASTMPLNQLLPPNVSTGSSITSQNINWVTNHTLDYSFDLGTAHRFTALIGVEAQQNTLENNRVDANNFPNDIVRTVNAGVISGGSSFKEQWSLASYFGRVGYTFNDKYLFNASIRRDGSSRFGANQRYGVFPSASVGWRVSEEPFLKNVAAISELKLKASFGLSGNNAFANYGSIGTLGIDNYVIGNGLANGLATNVIGNPNLTWEKSRQTDIGMELGLFKNRVFFLADYYSRITSDLLLSVQVPSLTGFTSANQNIGRVENKGMEFGLTTRNTVGTLAWTTDLNLSFNRNTVLALGPTGDAIRSGSGVGETNITVLGEPLGNFYGYQQIGVFRDQAELDAYPHFADSRPGDVKFADVNNDGVINANDRTLIGNNQPDFIYGINNTVTYGGFDLSISAQGVQGGQILNLSRRFIENLEGNQNQLATVLDRWQSPEQPGNGIVPRANTRSTGNNNAISSRWIESASYFRIRNITLGYRLPSSLSDRLKIQNARVYAGVQNAFTFTKYLGYNPEVSGYENALTGGVDYGSYPLARTYTIGLNLSF
ncbi:TonB-dependent receptor [Persicitalea jodogahamensis]|nr:TonB-dependent receptor [Persicitalea jodogahamensis]